MQALGYLGEERSDDGQELVILVDDGQMEDLVMCALPRTLGNEAEELKPLGGFNAAKVDGVEHDSPLRPSCIDDGEVRRGPDEAEERAHLGEVAAHRGGRQCGGSLVLLEYAAHALALVDHVQR